METPLEHVNRFALSFFLSVCACAAELVCGLSALLLRLAFSFIKFMLQHPTAPRYAKYPGPSCTCRVAVKQIVKVYYLRLLFVALSVCVCGFLFFPVCVCVSLSPSVYVFVNRRRCQLSN